MCHLRLTRLAGLGMVCLAAITFVACGDPGAPDTSAADADAEVQIVSSPVTLTVTEFWVCEVGSNAQFDARVIQTGAAKTVNLAAGMCARVHKNAGGPQIVSVTQTLAALPPTFRLDSIVKDTVFDVARGKTKITGGNWVDGMVSVKKGVITTFYNSRIGGQGCTPVFWRQDQNGGSWQGHAPTERFGSVFNLPAVLKWPEAKVDPASLTLQGALELKGVGVNALIRQAVAGLLNASNPQIRYDMSEADVIALFNAAIAGGDIEQTKATFVKYNRQRCPLAKPKAQ